MENRGQRKLADQRVERIGEPIVGKEALCGRIELKAVDAFVLDRAHGLAQAHLSFVRVELREERIQCPAWVGHNGQLGISVQIDPPDLLPPDQRKGTRRKRVECQMAKVGAGSDHCHLAPEPAVVGLRLPLVECLPACPHQCREGQAVEELAMVRMDCGFENVRQFRKDGREATTRQWPSRRIAASHFPRVQYDPGSKGGGPLVCGRVHAIFSFI